MEKVSLSNSGSLKIQYNFAWPMSHFCFCTLYFFSLTIRVQRVARLYCSASRAKPLLLSIQKKTIQITGIKPSWLKTSMISLGKSNLIITLKKSNLFEPFISQRGNNTRWSMVGYRPGRSNLDFAIELEARFQSSSNRPLCHAGRTP